MGAYDLKALFKHFVFTFKNLSCMALHAIIVSDKVPKLSSETFALQKHC